jgi:hypothetical protein
MLPPAIRPLWWREPERELDSLKTGEGDGIFL